MEPVKGPGEEVQPQPQQGPPRAPDLGSITGVWLSLPNLFDLSSIGMHGDDLFCVCVCEGVCTHVCVCVCSILRMCACICAHLCVDAYLCNVHVATCTRN